MEEYVESLYPILHELFTEKAKELLSHVGIDITRPSEVSKGTMYLIYINIDVRNQLTIDDVLSLYLIDVSDTVIVNFYKLVACFI